MHARHTHNCIVHIWVVSAHVQFDVYVCGIVIKMIWLKVKSRQAPYPSVLCQQAEFVKKVSKSPMSTLKRLFALSACGFHSHKGYLWTV